MKGENGGK